MVGYWNEWFTGILYMSDTKNYPLASFLQVIVCLLYTSNANPEGMDGIGEDIFIEISHGPTLVDNNVLLSDLSLIHISALSRAWWLEKKSCPGLL